MARKFEKNKGKSLTSKRLLLKHCNYYYPNISRYNQSNAALHRFIIFTSGYKIRLAPIVKATSNQLIYEQK